MSLIRIALRVAAVQALKGKTDVGDNVLDSQFGALDVGADNSIRTDQQKPFLALYTDAAHTGLSASGSGEPTELRTLVTNGITDIVIEAGIAEAMVQINPETDEAILTGIGAAATDRNLEAQLDIIIRQACDALNDPDDEWADIFRSLTIDFLRIDRSRAAMADGTKLAAHQLRISASLIDDPLPGAELDADGSFARFLAKASTISGDPDMTALINKMAGMFGGHDPEWKVLQRRHGMAQAELLALGRGPLANDEDRSTPDFAIGSIEVEGTGMTNSEENSG